MITKGFSLYIMRLTESVLASFMPGSINKIRPTAIGCRDGDSDHTELHRGRLQPVRISRKNGFTIVELMVALILTSIVTMGIYRIYISFSTSYDIQEQIAEMQQNQRIALSRMIKEIRMAGYNPSNSAGAGFVAAQTDNASIEFTKDDNGDGDTTDSNEDILYSLLDIDGDGVTELARKDVNGANNNQSVADNIEALNFVYLDTTGALTADTAKIHAVEVTIIVKSSTPNYSYINKTTYYNMQGDEIITAPNDNYRRRAIYTRIQCRNMGL